MATAEHSERKKRHMHQYRDKNEVYFTLMSECSILTWDFSAPKEYY
jgi:hypothetical protein